MKRSKHLSYELIKEERHANHEWLRQNRRRVQRFHLDYHMIRLTKMTYRNLYPTWKRMVSFKELLKHLETMKY